MNRSKRLIKLLLTEKIAHLMLGVLSIVLTYFGYQVNYNLQTIQNQYYRYEFAINYKHFWEDITKFEIETQNLSGQLGNASANILIHLTKFLSLLPNEFSSNYVEKELFLVDNTKLTAEWFAYVASHLKFINMVKRLVINYENSILQYAPVVEKLKIKSWDNYVSKHSQVQEWATGLITPYEEIFTICNKIVTENKIPNNLEAMAQKIGYKLGVSITKLSPPYLEALDEMKEENLENVLSQNSNNSFQKSSATVNY